MNTYVEIQNPSIVVPGTGICNTHNNIISLHFEL
jgi:hypothetical protein